MSNIIEEKLGIDLSKADGETRGFLRGLVVENAKNLKKFNDKDTKTYFHNLIAAIMLEYHKAYESFDIKVPYRIKSPKSIFDKVLEYLSRNDKSVYDYNSQNEYQGKLREDIPDLFALTIVSCNRPATFYSNDPEIQELIEEKKRNHILLGELQKFKMSIIKEEFPGTSDEDYNYFCTKKQYYVNCIMVLERLKTLIDPKATKLFEYYNNLLGKIKNNVPERFFYICDNMIKELNEVENLDNKEKLEAAYQKVYDAVENANLTDEENRELMKTISKKDTSDVDFLKLITDFNSRIHDKLDLAMLTKQVCSVFDKSPLLKKFGVRLQKDTSKRKRTEKGYVSNLYYIDTPFGKIEMQLQTQHENNESNYGYSAHSEISDSKDIERFEIPNLKDRKKVHDFRTSVELVSPQKFLAQFDNGEPNRIITQVFGKFQNYKSVASQVKRGSDADKEVKEYFAKLYEIRNKIFYNEDAQEKIESFIEYDIDQYLESDKFKKIFERADNKEER